MSERETVEQLLGVELEDVPLLAQVRSAGGDLDYTVVHAAVEVSRDVATWISARAGLEGRDTAAATLLPGGWSVEPSEPPSWWPADPTALDDQAARLLEPNGWLVCGYGVGRLWLLATWTAEA